MKKKYIYAFDLSLSCCGIVIFDENGKFVKVCSVSTDSKSERGLRLKIIADFILELAKEYEVGKIVLENVFFKHINATKALYQINGVLYYLFYDKDIITYQPQSVKGKICYGGAKKEVILNKIKSVYDVEFKNTDESDAFAVGLCYFIDNNIITWEKD